MSHYRINKNCVEDARKNRLFGELNDEKNENMTVDLVSTTIKVRIDISVN